MIQSFISRWVFLAVLIALSVALNGCKRGEDDPFLSVRTRDGRLMGEWNLTNLVAREETNITTNSNVTNILVENKYTGDDYTSDTTIITNNTSVKYTVVFKAYKMTMNILERGVLEGKQSFENTIYSGTGITGAITSNRSERFSFQGYWKWGIDDKNKSSVVLGTSNYGVSFGGFGTAEYKIKQLKKNEIVLEMSEYGLIDTAEPGSIFSEETRRFVTVTLTRVD